MWEMFFVDIGGIVDHHSMSWSERWFSLFNSLSDGQQFHQYEQKSSLTLIHWVMVNNSTNINQNHLSPKLIEWWSTIPPKLNRGVIFVDIGSGIVDHHSMSWSERWCLLILVKLLTITQWVEVRGFEWWSTISPISTKITSHLNSLSDGQQFHQYQQKSPLTLTHWVMVNNSTNIGDFCWYWWNCWPSVNEFRWEMIFVDIGGIVDHHSMSWSERWFLLIITSHLNSLSDGKQFHQYQQKSPLTSTHWMMVNNSPNINKNHLLILVELLTSLNKLKREVIFIDIGGIVDHHSMS
jgi:hypothetical protein